MKSYQRLIRLIRSQKGNVIALVAVSAMMLIATTGTTVDMARAQILQIKIQSALDAAGLAAGTMASSGNTSGAQAEAQKYFNANFPSGYMGVTGIPTLSVSLTNNNHTLTLSTSATQSTTFMKILGVSNISVGVSSQITIATSGVELVLVLDNTGSMADPVNSRNSSVSKIQALQTAITGTGGLLDVLYGANTTVPNVWIGVVPFTDMVNIGSGHPTWLDTNADASDDFGPTISGSCPSFNSATVTYSSGGYGSSGTCTYVQATNISPQVSFGMTNWEGCVTARSETTASPTTGESTLNLDESDDPPSSKVSGTLFPAFFYPSDASLSVQSRTRNQTTTYSYSCSGGNNDWGCSGTNGSNTINIYDQLTSSANGSGGNTNCVQTPILGMTATKTNVANEVNSMVAAESTFINLGMAWGWRMLSPAWQGYWGGEMNNTGNTQFPELPLPYNTALMNKVVILMTDGMNTSNSDAAYIGQTAPTVTTLDNDTKAICDAMKSHGIIIYTIGFGTTGDNDPSNPTSVNGPLLQYCATQLYSGDTSHYFLAPTNAQLATIFQQIGGELANLYVSQ